MKYKFVTMENNNKALREMVFWKIITPLFALFMVRIMFINWEAVMLSYLYLRVTRFIINTLLIMGIVAFAISIPRLISMVIKNRYSFTIRSKEKRNLKIICEVFFCVAMISFIPLIPSRSPPQLLIADSQGTYGIPNIGVCFYTQQKTRNCLLWWEENTTEINTISESVAIKEHTLLMNDLKQNTTYLYQLNENPIQNFTTPMLTQGLRCAFISDGHFYSPNNDSIQHRIMNNIQTNAYDYLFQVGDHVDAGMLDTQWQEYFDFIAPYTQSLPTRSVIGNHDAFFRGYDLYQKYLKPNGLDQGTNPSQLYQRIDVGEEIHFLMLDLEWGLESFKPDQSRWFENQLKSISQSDWTIVICHDPPYMANTPEGWGRISDFFLNISLAYDIDIFFSGHNHDFHHIVDEGVNFFNIATFGSIATEIVPRNAMVQVEHRYVETLYNGHTEVIINEDIAIVKFLNIYNETLYNWTITK